MTVSKADVARFVARLQADHPAELEALLRRTAVVGLHHRWRYFDERVPYGCGHDGVCSVVVVADLLADLGADVAVSS